VSLVVAWLLAALAVEYFLRVPLVPAARALAALAHKSIRVVSSKRISDHWKEKVLLRYSREMAGRTALVALMVAGCAPVIAVPALVLDWVFAPAPPIVRSLTSVAGVAGMTAVACVYAVIRKRRAAI
jgi:hypothetical protein